MVKKKRKKSPLRESKANRLFCYSKLSVMENSNVTNMTVDTFLGNEIYCFFTAENLYP